jgi:transcriptional regulator with XRE-family HTH domain
METGRFEDIRRSSPEQVKEHARWAPYAVNGATLAELRQLVGKTQEEMGQAMGVSGVEVGRFEKRNDVQLSTLNRYIAALGGELDVFARFGEKLVPLKVGPTADVIVSKSANLYTLEQSGAFNEAKVGGRGGAVHARSSSESGRVTAKKAGGAAQPKRRAAKRAR